MKTKRKMFLILSIFLAASGSSVYAMKMHWGGKDLKPGALQSPPLSEEERIKQVVRKNLKDIQDCYNSRLKEGFSGEGRLTIAWVIDEYGVPNDMAALKDELQDEDMINCSSQAIAKWRFPKNAVFQVNYTFNLKERDLREPASAETGETLEEALSSLGEYETTEQ